MALFSATDHEFVAAVGDIAALNPFLPERIEAERRALGEAFVESEGRWNLSGGGRPPRTITTLLENRARQIAGAARHVLATGAPATDHELAAYERLVLFFLYISHRAKFAELIAREQQPSSGDLPVTFYDAFATSARHFFELPGYTFPIGQRTDHVLAGSFQLARAFFNIIENLIGTSQAAVRFRASVWQSIFTHDPWRYWRVMYDRMADVSTLVTGPTGTGKELAARAIGLSRYVPFDSRRQRFVVRPTGVFHALNLSALAPTLIESELFGHRRGSFTGATADRAGWLEVCPALGTVFLDEIGDVSPTIQVKLLSVLQTREFQRLGDHKTLRFSGKIIAATNRDLAAEIRARRFREDFYYRLCSDVIVAPSLREHLDTGADELAYLIASIARRWLGDAEGARLTDEAVGYIRRHLPDHVWPGNFRELEQCVRSVMIRGSYAPAQAAAPRSPAALECKLAAARDRTMTLAELQRAYVTWVYAGLNNYVAAAQRLGVDRRTVRAGIDEALLKELRATHEP